MVYLSQLNPKWSFKTIGNSSSTIGRYGCAIVCLSMLSDYFGEYKDPAWNAKNLSFLVDKVIWKSVSEKLCFNFVYRYYKKDMEAFKKAMAGKYTACMFEVNNNHWVVGVRKSIYPMSKYWLVIDPLTGAKNWYHEGNITGGATFIKK